MAVYRQISGKTSELKTPEVQEDTPSNFEKSNYEKLRGVQEFSENQGESEQPTESQEDNHHHSHQESTGSGAGLTSKLKHQGFEDDSAFNMQDHHQQHRPSDRIPAYKYRGQKLKMD